VGSIVLHHRENSQDYDIIDGQQRLILVTFLLAKLAQLSKDDATKQYVHTIFERGIHREANTLGAHHYHLHLGTHIPQHQAIFD